MNFANISANADVLSELHIRSAAGLSHHHQLLTGDALIVAVMNAHGLTIIASNDVDFDGVPGITRYASP